MIESYWGKSTLLTAALSAMLAGDPQSVAEGLSRMSRGELTGLAEAADSLSRLASALVKGEDVDL